MRICVAYRIACAGQNINYAGRCDRLNLKRISGSSPIKIHYFDYPKRFMYKINEVYDFSIKYSDILLIKT